MNAIESLLASDQNVKSIVADAVRRITDDSAAVITQCSVQPVDYHVNVATTKLLHRIVGTAASPSRRHEWSIFVKEVGPAADGQPEELWSNWRLEMLAYVHGLLPSNARGLTGPDVYGCVDTPTGAIMFLEDIQGLSARQWRVERYRAAAFDLGFRQAQFTLNKTASTMPFLSPNLLESFMLRPQMRQAMSAVEQDAVWESELARIAFPRANDVRELLTTLWDRKGALFEALRSLPQTLSHGDLWPPNLFSVDTDIRNRRTVAVDPSWASLGPAGQDLPSLALDSVYEGMVPIAQLPRLERHVIAGYVDGFQRGGIAIDGKTVRFAFQAVSGIRFGFEAAAFLEEIAKPQTRERMERARQRDISEIARDGGRVISHALAHGRDALATLDGRAVGQPIPLTCELTLAS